MSRERESQSWVIAAWANAARALAELDSELQPLLRRREGLADSLQSLTKLAELEAPGELAKLRDSLAVADGHRGESDPYRVSMDRHMVNQMIHMSAVGNPTVVVAPPKRRQDYDSTTIRVLRLLADNELPLNAGEVVAFYGQRRWAAEEAAITQALRRNVGYGFVSEQRTANRAKVYVITPEGRAAIDAARGWRELKDEELQHDAEQDEAALFAEEGNEPDEENDD